MSSAVPYFLIEAPYHVGNIYIIKRVLEEYQQKNPEDELELFIPRAEHRYSDLLFEFAPKGTQLTLFPMEPKVSTVSDIPLDRVYIGIPAIALRLKMPPRMVWFLIENNRILHFGRGPNLYTTEEAILIYLTTKILQDDHQKLAVPLMFVNRLSAVKMSREQVQFAYSHAILYLIGMYGTNKKRYSYIGTNISYQPTPQGKWKCEYSTYGYSPWKLSIFKKRRDELLKLNNTNKGDIKCLEQQKPLL